MFLWFLVSVPSSMEAKLISFWNKRFVSDI